MFSSQWNLQWNFIQSLRFYWARTFNIETSKCSSNSMAVQSLLRNCNCSVVSFAGYFVTRTCRLSFSLPTRSINSNQKGSKCVTVTSPEVFQRDIQSGSRLVTTNGTCTQAISQLSFICTRSPLPSSSRCTKRIVAIGRPRSARCVLDSKRNSEFCEPRSNFQMFQRVSSRRPLNKKLIQNWQSSAHGATRLFHLRLLSVVI